MEQYYVVRVIEHRTRVSPSGSYVRQHAVHFVTDADGSLGPFSEALSMPLPDTVVFFDLPEKLGPDFKIDCVLVGLR